MRKMNKILSLVLSVAMVIGLVPMMTISSSAAFNQKFTFDANGEFTIVQLTDIQDDKEVHEDALALITKAMSRYSPDLVVFTGDNIAGKMSASDTWSSINQFMAPIINAGVPYAMTFGNHDEEDATLVNTPSKQEQYDYAIGLSDYAVDFDVDELSGTGTGGIPIYSHDGSQIKFAVFPVDSGNYDQNGDYDHVKADQLQWYEQQVAAYGSVPHLVFQHIIVPEVYTKLLVKAESTTPGAIQGHGNWSSNYYVLDPSNPTITGQMNEQPCPSAINGGQYDAMVRTGCMVGNFVGHDHTNNFVGTTADGITIGYTEAVTMHSYGNHDPACRVFTIKEDGTYTSKNVRLSEMGVEDADDYEHDTIAGTPTVPSRLVVGAAGNGLTQQRLGNVIQQYTVNHRTQALYPNDMAITIDLAADITDVTLIPQSGIDVSAPTVTTSADGATKTYNWTITGGTATAGTAAEFKFTYKNAAGAEFSQYAYSYVDDIRTPAGYYFFTRNYRGGDSSGNHVSQTYVMTVLGDTAYGDARSQTDSALYGYEGREVGSWTNATAGYYNYTGSDDGGFTGMGDSNYGLIFTSPARANCRTLYDFPRFTQAGKSPVSTVYVDTSVHSTMADLHLSVNYWRHMAPDHDLTTDFSLYFKIGDVGYSTGNLQEGTAGTTSINANLSTITLAAARGSSNNFQINGTLPANGTQYTMISRGYTYWNGNYETEHRTYAPVLLSFVTYDKAEIKELVNAERTAMRQTEDVVYRAAFKEAYKQVMKINTTQADIDAAIVLLNSAIDALTFDGTDVSNNGQYAGTSTVPPVIYIAGNGYGLAQQPTGTTIQSGVIDYASNEINRDYSRFYFNAPQGATGVSVQVTESNGNPVEYTWDAGTNSGQITGGTSAQNAFIKYVFSYTLGGKLYEQVEASAVLPAPQAAGWTSMVKGSTDMSASVYRTVFETAILFGNGGVLPAGAYYTGQDVFSGANYGINLDPGSNNNFVGYGYQKVAGTGMAWWEVTRARQSNGVDWLCAYDGQDGKRDFWSDPGRDMGHRARFDITIDSSVIPNLSSIGTGFKYISLQNQNRSSNGTSNNTNPTVLQVTNHAFYNGFVSFTDVVNGSNKTTAIRLGTSVNAQGQSGDNTYGVKAGDTLSLTYGFDADNLPPAGNYSFWTELTNEGSYKSYAHYMWNFTINYVNKTAIRNYVATEEENYRQLSDGYDNSDGSFTAFQTALAKAKAAITDVTLNDADTANIQTELQTAIANLKYLPADYTKLQAKVLEVRIQNTDGTYSYRPHPANDPTYYNTGDYYAWNNFSSTNEVDIAIKDINWDYDVRYQNKIDMMVDAIDVGWINVTLVNADYTNVDRFLSNKTGTGANGAAGGANIKVPAKYGYLMLADPMLPAEYYTTETYNAWTNACAIGQSDRSLKKPDQPVVDGYAAALETAYNNLTLLSADFSPLDEVQEAVQESLDMTVEVVDPSNAENNYPISYYSPELIAQIREKLAQRDAGLTIIEQDKVEGLVVEIDALYQELSSTLNKVDMTFANEQKAIEAEYEAEAEKYYTAESWQRLVDARAAANDRLASREADSQVTVNAVAKEIYDARNALEYNAANYDAVNEYLALIAAEEANKDWYANWSAVDVATANVVTGLDVTEQARVDKMAADLKAAYEGLALKDANYANLKAAIDLANERNKDAQYYTADTYSVFADALAAANTMYTDGQTAPLKINEQAKVDAVEAALRDAMGKLAYQDANINPLVEAMNTYNQTVFGGMYMGEYPDADEDGYEDILDGVRSAYAQAEQWIAAYEADELTIKDNTSIALAATNLETLRAALPACYMMVYDALIDPYTGEALYNYATDGKLSAYISTLEANLKKTYTDESVKDVVNALKAINYNYKIDDQALVDEASGPVYETVAMLEYRPANLDELIAAIAAGDEKVAKAESTDWFTPETWADYEDAYNAAVDVRDADPAYSALEQDIVDEAAQALADATAALEYVDADYDALNAAIAEADELNKNDWTPETWADLEVALAAAKAVQPGLKIDSQPAIDTAAQALVDAIEALKSGVLDLVGIGDTVIDNERGFIYGLVDADFEEITDLVAQGYAEVVGNGYVKYTPVEGNSNLGTGAVVELIRGADDGDDSNNEVVKTYYIVIFGDLNGDAFITNDDIYDLTQYAAWNDTEYDYESQMDMPQVFAMDIDANGEANLDDAYYVLEYGAWNIDEIKQTYTGQ